MISRIRIEEFLQLAGHSPVLDVRSPSEYGHAHMPGAISFPLFSDEERKQVGTTYKQLSREKAIKIGLDYFGVRMRPMVEIAEDIVRQHYGRYDADAREKPAILVHCWRGGMRSAAIAWLLDLYGFRIYTLAGGYKAYRHWVLQQLALPHDYRIIGGYTGSGKTDMIEYLQKQGHQVLNLEDMARHRGSAFGALGMGSQPTQEYFENMLANQIATFDNEKPVWSEDESRRIGNLNIPEALWYQLRKATVYFADVPVEERLNRIIAGYGKFRQDELAANIVRIKKRLGGVATKDALGHLIEGNHKECFRILLHYYDKFYTHDIEVRRKETVVHTVSTNTGDADANARLLLGTSISKEK